MRDYSRLIRFKVQRLWTGRSLYAFLNVFAYCFEATCTVEPFWKTTHVQTRARARRYSCRGVHTGRRPPWRFIQSMEHILTNSWKLTWQVRGYKGEWSYPVCLLLCYQYYRQGRVRINHSNISFPYWIGKSKATKIAAIFGAFEGKGRLTDFFGWSCLEAIYSRTTG